MQIKREVMLTKAMVSIPRKMSHPCFLVPTQQIQDFWRSLTPLFIHKKMIATLSDTTFIHKKMIATLSDTTKKPDPTMRLVGLLMIFDPWPNLTKKDSIQG